MNCPADYALKAQSQLGLGNGEQSLLRSTTQGLQQISATDRPPQACLCPKTVVSASSSVRMVRWDDQKRSAQPRILTLRLSLHSRGPECLPLQCQKLRPPACHPCPWH